MTFVILYIRNDNSIRFQPIVIIIIIITIYININLTKRQNRNIKRN